jgi:hypothetical protein
MTSQPRKYHKNGPFSRLPLVWLICCLAGGGWLMLGGLKPAVESHYAPAVALTADDKPTYITKNIEDIQVGDWVLAKDPDDAGPPTPHRVIGLPRNWTEHVVHIQVKGQGDLQATRTHPFWVAGRGWLQAKDLRVGDRLQDDGSQLLAVTKVRIEDRVADTFNLTVDGVHTYYVLAGDQPVLVHNAVQPFQFGNYNDLVAQSEPGDGLVIHHYPQGQPASEIIPGYEYDSELAVAVPTDEHLALNGTNFTANQFTGTTQQLIDEAYANMQGTSISNSQLNALDAEARARYLPPNSPCP